MRLIISYIIIFLVSASLQAQFSNTDSVRIESLLSIINSQQPNSVQQKLDAYINLAQLYKGHDVQKAFHITDSAEVFLQKNNRQDLMPRVYNVRGLFHFNKGKYLQALYEYQRGIESYQREGHNTPHTGFLHIDIGNIFYQLHQYKDAIIFYNKAFDIFKTNGEPENLGGQAVALNNIGLCRLQLNQFQTGLSAFLQAFELRKTMQDSLLITHSYTHLMEAYLAYDHLKSADSLISYAYQSGRIDRSSIWFKNLQLLHAELLIKQGKIHQAGLKLSEVEKFSFGPDQDFFDPAILQVKARLEIARGNYPAVKNLVQKGYDQAMEQRDYMSALTFSTLGKEVSLKENNTGEALRHSENIISLRDSLQLSKEGLVGELLDLNMAFVKTQEQNRKLKSVSENFHARIQDQNWLLIAALSVIFVLLILFWYINKLSKRQKKNEINQRELNQRILAVVNHTDSIILSLNEKGEIRLINQSAIEFFRNWTGSEIRAGDNLLEKLANHEGSERWQKWFEKSKEFNGWKEVSQITLRDKVYYYLENFSAITREGGKYAGLVLVANDITKEHEFNVELSQQRDILVKGNKAKEKMLSILAHDLKDAIYSARSLSEMVIETPEQFPKEELIHLFSLLFNNFDRTKNLLDGLLEWMKTQTGAMEAKASEFYLYKLASEVMEDCREKASAKGIEITINGDADITANADREMIKTVLRNLVSNAIKYTSPDTGKILISSRVFNDKVEVHVKDNGTGMSMEAQRKLFQFNGRFTTPGTNNELGTGFGLSLCKELLRLNNTSLHLQSEEQQGSDFYFSLPLVNKKDSVLGHTY